MRLAGRHIEHTAGLEIAKRCCKPHLSREEMLIDTQHTWHLKRQELTVLKVVHVIVVTRDCAVRLAAIAGQAPARDALGVLPVDLFLESLGRAPPGQNAIQALAEVPAATAAVILAN